MELNEAIDKCNTLSKLNLEIWFTHDKANVAKLRETYKKIYREVIDGGYNIRRSRVFSSAYNMRIPHAVPIIMKHKDALAIVNNRPATSNRSGDCTTRCMVFCTGEDYNKLLAEQLANAKRAGRGYTWRQSRIWKKSLFSRDFNEIILRRHVTRATFIRMMKDSGIQHGIIASVSSSHVAAINMATMQVMDTWDSTGGRITSLIVPKAQKEMFMRALMARDLI